MNNNYWYNQNQYWQNPYQNSYYYCNECPVMQDYYRSYEMQPYYQDYYGNNYDSFYRSTEEDFIDTSFDETNTLERNFNITKDIIDDITASIRKDSMHIFKDIEGFITDTRLMDYMLAALITYICNNYYKYENVIDDATDDLVEELRRNLPWVFDILKVFGITPKVVDKFLDDLIRSTVENLRKKMPANL